ncbi:MAG: DUF4276 family protein [Candidatus Thorarchaeota archaeon]|nr:DUF4276 family protein [Candidatus Thorarchaeota archaeon]
MISIVPVVEGDGEVEAVPLLLRRFLERMNREDIIVARALNAHGRSNITKPGGFERLVEYAQRKDGAAGILVLIDADSDCPKELVTGLCIRAKQSHLVCPLVLIAAKPEYEAWFLASIETIRGRTLAGTPGLDSETSFEGDPERIRGAKEILGQHMGVGRTYKETLHQAPMTEYLDLNLAIQRSRSFRRLGNTLKQLLQFMDAGETRVTPDVCAC